MSLLCSLLPPSSSSSSSLLLPPPTRPSLPLPSSSSCYLCFLCFFFSVFFFPLALALSVVSRAHFASLLLPPLSFFALLASLLFFSSSITSSSSLLFLLTPPLTSFSLQTPLPLPLSSSPSIFPFYLSLSHDLNSSHHLSYFASYSALPSLLALLYMLSSSLPASLILLPDSTSPFLCIVYFPTFKFTPFRPPSIHYGVTDYGSCAHISTLLYSHPFPLQLPFSLPVLPSVHPFYIFLLHLCHIRSPRLPRCLASFYLPVSHLPPTLTPLFSPPSPGILPSPSLCHLTSLFFFLASSCLPSSLPFSSYCTSSASSASPFSFASSSAEQETWELLHVPCNERETRN